MPEMKTLTIGGQTFEITDPDAKDKDWFPKLEEIGAAPSGYGLGEQVYYTNRLTSIDELNALNKTCEFAFTPPAAVTICGTTFSQAFGRHTAYHENGAHQELFMLGVNATFERDYWNGVWSEWVNASPSAFAPAGHGLGEIAGTVNDLSALKVSGWWEYAYNATDNPFNGFGGVVLVSASPAITEQKAVTGFGGCTAKRHLSYGDTEYSEWEWDNPPMLPGVEYRTTERWNGKAVYTKLVNGGIVGTGGVMVYWSFSKTPTHIVRTTAKINTEAIGDIVLPHIYGTMESGYTAVCAPCRDSILFACGANVTGQAYAQVWYTYD